MFKERELKAPGYRTASTSATGRRQARPNTTQPPRRIQWAHEQGGLATKGGDTVKQLLPSTISVTERWINTLYDNYEHALLRADMKTNTTTRMTTLEVLGKMEEANNDAVTIKEVLPFVEKYKLTLRVLDAFYNLVYKYGPATLNFNYRPFGCVTDGEHIHTPYRDLGNLAQQSENDTYNVSVGSNFIFPINRARTQTTSSSNA